jgi:hypothetical protein
MRRGSREGGRRAGEKGWRSPFLLANIYTRCQYGRHDSLPLQRRRVRAPHDIRVATTSSEEEPLHVPRG